MQLIQGLVSEAIKKEQGADNPNALFLDVSGRAIRISVPDERADVLSIREGDSVIIAGHGHKPVFTGLAYRNVSQKQETYRVSAKDDSIGAWFFLFFGLLFLWFSLTTSADEPLLYQVPPRALSVAVSSIILLLGAILILPIIDKYAASFLVDSAALETFAGPARIVPREGQEGRVADAEVQGRRVTFDLSGGFVIENGDVLAVTAEQVPDYLRGLSYRNVTRSLNGKSWVTEGWLLQIPLLLAFAALFAGVGFDRSLADPWNYPAFGVGICAMIALFQFILDRFYRWRYYREARRRTAAAAARLALSSA